MTLALLAVSSLLGLAQDPEAEVSTDSPMPVIQPQEERRELPLRLEDVVRLVAENAPAIRQAHLRALSSGGSIEEASGLFDPVFFADATFTYSERPSSGGFLSGGVSNTHSRNWDLNQGIRATLMTGGTVQVSLNENYTEDNLPASFFGFNPESNVGLSVNVTQPLLKGAWLQAGTQNLRAAELSFDRNLASLEAANRDAVQQAIDGYWDLAFAIEDVKVKELSLELAQELRDITMAKYRVGSAAEVEVVQTDADIATRTEAVLTARNNVRLAEDSLRTLLFDLREQQEWDLALVPMSSTPTPAYTALEWEQAFVVAREHRPDLRELRVDVEQAKLDWDVAERNQLPQLDLIVSGTSLGLDQQIADAFDPVFEFLTAGYSVGLSLEVPLGNRQYHGTERRTRWAYQLAQRALRDRENLVASEVRDAVRSVNYLTDRVAATVKAREVAERQLEAEQRRLQEGASTNFQVLQFQEDLEQALTSEKGAAIEFAKAVTRLSLVQGLGWDGSAPTPMTAEEPEAD